MGNIFRIDSKIMQYGTKLAYLLWLQGLTILCCIPIVTAGASLCAMHKILLQIYRDEESNITRTFFKSFRDNLRQATIMWIIYLAFFALLVLDYIFAIQSTDAALRISVYLLPILAIAAYLSLQWLLPLQSRYESKIIETIKLSFTMILFRPFYTILLAILSLIPLVLLFITMYAFPYVLFLGITVPGLLQTILYSQVFDYLEGTNWRREKAEALLERTSSES